MNLTKEEKTKFLEEVRAGVIEKAKQRTIERILDDNGDRIEKHIAEVSHELSETIAREFPLWEASYLYQP